MTKSTRTLTFYPFKNPAKVYQNRMRYVSISVKAMQCCSVRRSFVATTRTTNVNNCGKTFRQIMGSKSKYLICRLCLSYGEVLVDVCESDTEPGFEVRETIEDLLRVEVVAGGDLPWLICLNCIGKLEDFSNFKFKCISSNSAFVQRFTKPRQSVGTGVRPQANESSCADRCGTISASSEPKGSSGTDGRVVVVNMGSGAYADARRNSGEYNCGITPRIPSPSKVSKCSTTTTSSFKAVPVPLGKNQPSCVKAEGGVPLMPGCQVGGQIGSGVVIISKVPTAPKDLCFRPDDPREVVQSEMEEESEDQEEEDRKDGLFIGGSFEHEPSRGCGSTAGTSEHAANPCLPQPATRMVVYAGGVEGGGVCKALPSEAEVVTSEQGEVRGDKIPSREMSVGRGVSNQRSTVAVLMETPLERKRRMARERQRRFRARQLHGTLQAHARQSSKMEWRWAQDDAAQYSERQWSYERPTTNSGDEGSPREAAEESDPKVASY